MSPKTSAYLNIYYGQTKWMYSLIEYDEFLEKYNSVWDKLSADIKINLISSLSIVKIIWKSKTKSHSNKVTDFCDKRVHKLDRDHTCLAVITLDSALKKDDNYYPQEFSK